MTKNELIAAVADKAQDDENRGQLPQSIATFDAITSAFEKGRRSQDHGGSVISGVVKACGTRRARSAHGCAGQDQGGPSVRASPPARA